MEEYKIGDILRHISSGKKVMIIGIDVEMEMLCVYGQWISVSFVNEYYEKVK